MENYLKKMEELQEVGLSDATQKKVVLFFANSCLDEKQKTELVEIFKTIAEESKKSK